MTKSAYRFLPYFLFVMTVSSASACMLKISAGQESPQAGSEDVITLQFIQSHRNCTIKPESTEIKTDGMKITGKSDWEPVRSGVYERTFHVEYAEKGTASFKAVRTCPKGGMTQELKIEVQ